MTEASRSPEKQRWQIWSAAASKGLGIEIKGKRGQGWRKRTKVNKCAKGNLVCKKGDFEGRLWDRVDKRNPSTCY
uniref:Uncharacterized protein n=1 Tax=Arundo donax TaxID=35708 RepID=A0A0A9PQQ9_ARUDO